MQNLYIRVKKDAINDHLKEGDYRLIAFKEKLDEFEVQVDTINNFYVIFDYEHEAPVYLEALKTFYTYYKDSTITFNHDILFDCYLNGLQKGYKTPINLNENTQSNFDHIITIFSDNSDPFHYDAIYKYFDYNFGQPGTDVPGFCEQEWIDYGFQIGKEKKAWQIILKDPHLFNEYLQINLPLVATDSIQNKMLIKLQIILNALQSNIVIVPNKNKEATNYNSETEIKIKQHLDEFRNYLDDSNYELLSKEINDFFELGINRDLPKPITVHKINKKKFGWMLGEILYSIKSTKLNVEYLKFIKKNISLYRDTQFDENNPKKSCLYKYITTKIK